MFVKLVLTRNADVARVPPHPPKCRRFVLPHPPDAKLILCGHFWKILLYPNCISSLPFFFLRLSFIPFSAHFGRGGGEAPPVFFTPPQAREMLRHIDDVDTCVLSVCLSFLLACFLSFVFACSVLVYTSSPVSSLPHCATFIPLIFLLGNGPPRREDYPTAISNADVCKQMLAGNEECS